LLKQVNPNKKVVDILLRFFEAKQLSFVDIPVPLSAQMQLLHFRMPTLQAA